MAIISMCLVAIFALVQSIPLQTPTPVPAAAEPEVSVPAAAASGKSAPPAPTSDVVLVRPAPRPVTPQAEHVVLQRPAPKPASEARAKPPAPGPVEDAPRREPNAEPGPGRNGFTLRFESDDALIRLVAREVIGLYAMSPAGTSRLSVDDGRPAFWKSSAPERVHEMDPATVPGSLLAAWRRLHGGAPEAVRWGVALPPAMTRKLNSFLDGEKGGSLVIDAGGDLRLEQ